MPTPRKRIGFLPSEEVQEIINKLCNANEFSQSKVTGLLVEEALRSRGVLKDSLEKNDLNQKKFVNYLFEQELISKTEKTPYSSDVYKVNKKAFSDNIKMMHEFIEFKYFKKVLMENNNIYEQ